MPKHRQTFEKGINQDVTKTFQPQGTYRDLWNGMLLGQDGNKYSVQTPLGNVVSFTIPPRYNSITEIGGTVTNVSYKANPLPIGFISFPDYLAVFSTSDQSEIGGYGEIGTVTFTNNGQATYKPLYNHVDLKFSQLNQIKGIADPENDKIERVYFRDDLNGLRILNLKDDYFAPVASGQMQAGKYYMVTGGVVKVGGVGGTLYGCGLPAGNIINGSIASTYTVIHGTPVVTRYINISSLDIVPNKSLGDFFFTNSPAGGNLTGGAKQYYYRLGFKSQGYWTSWSYGSFPINVSGIKTHVYKDQVGSGGLASTKNSGRAVQIQITNIDTVFDGIQVACVAYDEKPNVISSISVIAEEDITGSTMVFTHSGNETLKDLSPSELTTFTASITGVGDITTNKNYLILADIEERQNLTLDVSSVTIDYNIYKMPAVSKISGDPLFKAGAGVYWDGERSPVGGTFSDLVVDGFYEVSGGSGDSVTYNSQNYTSGSIIQIIHGDTNALVASGSPKLYAGIRIKQYTKTGSVSKYKFIRFNGDFWDFKGMATSMYLRPFWGNETYRLCFVAVDKKGNPFFGQWIGDKKMPSAFDIGGHVQKYDNNTYSLKLKGLKVSGIKIPASMANEIGGFCIMRAPRDKQIWAQGIVFQTVLCDADSKIRPMSLTALQYDYYWNNHAAGFVGASNTYTFHSPDLLFPTDEISEKNFKNADLDIQHYLTIEGSDEPSQNWAINRPTTSVDENRGVTPYLYYDSNGQLKRTITLSQTLNSESVDATIGNNGFVGFANNTLRVDSSSYFAQGRYASPSKCTVIQTDNPIEYSGIGIHMIGQNEKPLANIVIPKTNLYGGSSPLAVSQTPFISTGHFQKIDSSVLSEVPLVDGNYVFNDIEVWGGDCYLTLFDQMKASYNASYPNSYNHAILYAVESNVNPSLREGYSYGKDGWEYSVYGVRQDLRPESYALNLGYNSDGDPFKYPSLPINFQNNRRFGSRIRWSAYPKILGEQLDSWRIFPVNNYRDLNSNYGDIKNITTIFDKTIFHQEKAIGSVPVMERQVVTTESGQATELGRGGMIDDYNIISEYFGNQHRYGLCKTETGIVWFDMRRRAILDLDLGGGLQEISAALGLQTFFNNQFHNTYQPTNINSDKPLIGYGITSVYDPRFKVVLMTFHPNGGSTDASFTIIYSVKDKCIAGFSNATPAIWHEHNGILLSSKFVSSFQIAANHNYKIGDEVQKNLINYVCIKKFSTGSTVTSDKQPDLENSDYWKMINKPNQIWQHWKGDVAKFYGKVYPTTFEFIVNPQTNDAFTVDNMEVKGNNVKWDSITYTNDLDTATDKFPNRNYRFFDGKWFNNLPIGKNGRLTDTFLSVKCVRKNYTENITESDDKIKIVSVVDSVYRERK